MTFFSGPTSTMPETRRFLLLVFFTSMWFPVALRRRILPVGVIRNRFAAPRCDFIFGIVRSFPSVFVRR